MAEQAEELKNLISIRGQLKAAATRFRTYAHSLNENSNLIQVRLRLTKFQDSWNDFQKLQSSIELIENNERQLQERDFYENQYFETVAIVEDFLSIRTESNRPPSQNSVDNIQVKLPSINLPNFSGNYRDWVPFYETFYSLIHNNEKLTNVQRLHYLKASLKHEAASLISSLSMTDDNYAIAFDLLKSRYYNKRLIIKNHVKALTNLPSVTKNSAESLRQLLNTVTLNLKLLKNLQQPVEFWDLLIIENITSKLDSDTIREWESFKTESEIPTFKDISTFLTSKCQLLESIEFNKNQNNISTGSSSTRRTINSSKPNYSMTHATTNQYLSCPYCSNRHYLNHCPELLKLSIDERIEKVRNLKRCLNCLRDHNGVICKSNFSCRTCGKRHHSILHLASKQPIKSSDQSHNDPLNSNVNNQANEQTSSLSTNHSNNKTQQVLLSTAIVYVPDSKGFKHEIRCLIDNGSQSSFISNSACVKLGLKPKPCNLPISGINQSLTRITHVVDIEVQSRYNSFKSNISCLILDKITNNLPTISFNCSQLTIPKNINLADPNFNISSPIDLLLGAELFWKLLCVGQIKLGANAPILTKSNLGWLIGGNLQLPKTNKSKSIACHLVINPLDAQLAKFWEVENYENFSHSKTLDEVACEQFFMDSYTRDSTGRFVVRLPFKSDASPLGNSKNHALTRFYALERKLSANKSIQDEYSKFMNEYLTLGHMSLVNHNENVESRGYYLPYHIILKDSTTTKLRVVFDGSAKTTTGHSLNDTLMVGPKIQQDLYSILLRFRTFKYAFSADIIKMYRQIMIAPEDRDYQLILWRDSPSDPINIYTLNTVTYGTSPAPFLAIRSLQQLAVDEQASFPKAHNTIINNFYVDDVLSGANSLEEAIDIQTQLIAALSKGGFLLQKWASNHAMLIPETNTVADQSNAVSLDKQDEIKILGLTWATDLDSIKYSINHINNQSIITKRTILSMTAQLFDPLGLVSPVLIIPKIILQKLWYLKLDWDDPVPISINTEWLSWLNQLPLLNKLKINRYIFCDTQSRLEFHGFCDASQTAYGACIYVKSIDNNGLITVNLLTSKSRVAPLKSITIPRLELLAAHTLAILMNSVKNSISHVQVDQFYFWTDSTIVLSWLNNNVNNLKIFVANRVSKIQSLTNINDWRHISTKENPADLISRGLHPCKLLNANLWWQGPPWLLKNCSEFPQPLLSKLEIPEMRIVHLVTTVPELTFIKKFSSFRKLQRVTAYCLRFYNNCQGNLPKQTGNLTVEELHHATSTIIKYIQHREFATEVKALKSGTFVKKSSPIRSLNPFLDYHNLLRVGGRLNQSSLPYETKHQLLLPGNHHVTKLLIQQVHEENFHAGQQATLSFMRQNYWPTSGKSNVRKILHNCITCFRAKPISPNQLMGNLPAKRTEPARPFIHCGIDFAGPIHLRMGRGKVTTKAYIAIFVCFATKAVHIELVGDLSTQTFLNALKRFVSRRGNVLHIYCDNATNFKGAQRELHELEQVFCQQQLELINFSTTLNITWHFIPPRSPHFGGLWEAGVKSIKYFLRRIVGNASLNYEEMYTLLTRIEAILNSRPLTPVSNDANDLMALTPGHFLIGESLTSPLDPDLTKLQVNRLSRWQHIEQLRQHFWRRWSCEYLTQLQQRVKWSSPGSSIKVGMLVLVRDINLPPLHWPLGRITQLHPGTDGIVRVVSVQTKTGVVRRSIVNICVLPTVELSAV